MATYNAEEVIDEHEFELLNQLEEEEEELIFYVVSLGEEGMRERRWEVCSINTRREEQGEFVLLTSSTNLSSKLFILIKIN